MKHATRKVWRQANVYAECFWKAMWREGEAVKYSDNLRGLILA